VRSCIEAAGLTLPPALYALLGSVAGLAVPIQPRQPGWVDPAVDKSARKAWTTVTTIAFLVLGTVAGIYLWNAIADVPKGHPSYDLIGVSLLLMVVVPVVSVILGWLMYTLRVRTQAASRAQPTVGDSLEADRQFVARNRFGYLYLGFIPFFLLAVLPQEFNLVYLLVVVATVASMFAWHASPSFRVTRWLLQGRLPRQLLTFLEDARSRGILRQAGTVYQFRHAMLQQYLADPALATTATATHARLPGRAP
jgi:hypothetical protein